MLINKLLIIISTLFVCFALHAQPTYEPSVVGVFVKLEGSKGESLNFTTLDSLNFISSDKKYHFYVKILTHYKDTVSRIEHFYLGLKEGAAHISHRKNMIKGSYFTYISEDNTYQLVYPFSEIVFHNYTRIAILFFCYKGKEMKVFIDFTDREEEFLRSEITISFQEGVFEIKDPKEPKLIPIKKGRK